MSKPTAEEYIKNNPLYEFLDGTVTPRPDLKFDRKGNRYKVKCKKCGEKSEFKDDNVYNVKCKHCKAELNLDDIPRKEKPSTVSATNANGVPKKSKKKTPDQEVMDTKDESMQEESSDSIIVEDPSSDEEDSLGAQLEATFKDSKLVSETPAKKTEKAPKKTTKAKTEKPSPEGLIKQLDSDLSIKELLKLIKPNSSGNIEIIELKQGQILKYKDKLYIVE